MASIREQHQQIVTKARSAQEITQEALDRISAVDGRLNSFLLVTGEQAIAQAKAIDAKVAAGEEIGLLAGIPIGIKDNLCTQGIPTTCASKMLQHFIPPYESTVTAKLKAVRHGRLHGNLGLWQDGQSLEPRLRPRWLLGRIGGGGFGPGMYGVPRL
jgi:aspartyl-tRNA(Asn)/glutamyl-tRNA(Gln) amidotransferase subunit A